MEGSSDQVQSDRVKDSTQEDRGGCGLVGLFIISALSVVLLSLLAQFLIWTVGEMVFYGIHFPDLRWVIELGFSLALLIPSGVLLAVIPNRFHKRIYLSFFLAGIYCLVLFPVHFAGITSAQLTNVLQTGASLLFLGGLLLWDRQKRDSSGFYGKPAWPDLWLGMAVGMASGFFWLAWGAFGSLLDTLLNLISALALGTAVIFIIKIGLFPTAAENAGAYRRRDILLFGLIVWLIFLAAGTAFGHNGSQMLLGAILPWTAWPVVAYLCRSGGSARLWPAVAIVAPAAAWPMMLVDPDELSTIINAGSGELIEVAAKAGVATLLILLMATILSLINPRRKPSMAGWLAAISLAECAAIYLFIGHVGSYGEKLFVILKDQPDTGKFEAVQDIGQRRIQIYRNLTAEANKSQAGLRADLDRLNISYKPYYLVNALEVDGGPLIKWWLESKPDVDRVLDNPQLRPLPASLPTSKGDLTSPPDSLWNLEMIEAGRVHEELGITGKGIVVGQSDSGVDGTHPELADSYRGRISGDDYNWFDPWYGSPRPVDQNGHGTHTLGTILGDHVGIAPDAEWIACANLRRNLGNPAVYLDCMQFMLAPFPEKGDPFKDGKPELGANVMNNSWGCPEVEGCDPGTFLQAVRALRAAGVFMVVSAGNTGDGGCSSISDPPAIYGEVLSVGAVNSARQRSGFSSLGPVTVDGSGRIKPDLMAPGEQVISAFPENTYAPEDGTSMAGPHVVGVVALMWSANPNLIGDIDRTTEILEKTASRVQDSSISCENNTSFPNNETGFGIVNAYEAVKAAVDAR